MTNGKKETEKVEIPLGTTINYDPYTGVESSKLTATTETEKTGKDAQTYTISNNEAQKLIWQVFGTDDDGNILIMPTTNAKDPTGATQYMAMGNTDPTIARNAGQYAAEEVNRICSICGYGKGAKSARSMQIQDIDKLTEFDKTTYQPKLVNGYGHNVTYSINETDGNVYCSWSGTTGPQKTSYKKLAYLKGNEWISLEKGQSVTITGNFYGYSLSNDPCKATLTNKGVNDLITKNTLNQSYRLASSYVMTLSRCLFYGIPVVSNFSVSGCSFFIHMV